MSVQEHTSSQSLIERIKSIILKPSETWDRIDAEPATVQGLFTGYAMILAAIGPICRTVGLLVFGMGIPGLLTFRPSPIGLIVSALVSYALSLAMVYVMALVIDAMAPSFDGTKDRLKAMKVAVYGCTAGWLAGVFGLVPLLGIFALAGLYSLYLIYIGLPKLMRAPKEKALGYTAVVIVLMIVFAVVISLVTAPLAMLGAATGAGLAGNSIIGAPGAKVSVGGAAVDLGALAAASKQMQASAAAMQANANAAVPNAGGQAAVVQGVAPDTLKALLPASVAGLPRTEVSAEAAGAAGMGASHAEGVYQSGDTRLQLEVTDTAAMAGLAGLASAFQVNSSKDTATGYEKVSTINGRMTTESYDRTSKNGKYSVLAGGRFMIAAEGTNLPIDQLKAAVDAVGVQRVEALAPH